MGSGAPAGGYDPNSRRGLANASGILSSVGQVNGRVAGTGTSTADVSAAQSRLDSLDPAQATPDLTDEAIRRAQLAAQRKLLEGQGFGNMFLTGPLGASGNPAKAPPAPAAPKAP
jgi:hypothetical protein